MIKIIKIDKCNDCPYLQHVTFLNDIMFACIKENTGRHSFYKMNLNKIEQICIPDWCPLEDFKQEKV